MKTWNYKEASQRLSMCLDRELALGKVAEDVTTIKDPSAAQHDLGAAQQAEIENSPAIAPVEPEAAENTAMAEGIKTDEIHVNGTDGSANTQEVGMNIKKAPESTSKEASLGEAFARGLHTKYASVKAAAEEAAPYMTGIEMFQKKAAMMEADADSIEKAASEFYAGLEELQKNPCFQKVFQKCAAQKMAEDIAAAKEMMGEDGANADDAAIAADLQAAVEADPELQAELEGEITNDAIDELAMAEQQAAVIDQIAAEAGVAPEDVVEAAALIEEAAAENNMPVEEFVQVLDAAMQEEAAAAEAPVVEEAPVEEVPVVEEAPVEDAPAEEAPVEEAAPVDQVKEASYRRIAKAASIARNRK